MFTRVALRATEQVEKREFRGADQSRRLHEALPHSQLHLVENAGHMGTYADLPWSTDALQAMALTAPTEPESKPRVRRN